MLSYCLGCISGFIVGYFVPTMISKLLRKFK